MPQGLRESCSGPGAEFYGILSYNSAQALGQDFIGFYKMQLDQKHCPTESKSTTSENLKTRRKDQIDDLEMSLQACIEDDTKKVSFGSFCGKVERGSNA